MESPFSVWKLDSEGIEREARRPGTRRCSVASTHSQRTQRGGKNYRSFWGPLQTPVPQSTRTGTRRMEECCVSLLKKIKKNKSAKNGAEQPTPAASPPRGKKKRARRGGGCPERSRSLPPPPLAHDVRKGGGPGCEMAPHRNPSSSSPSPSPVTLPRPEHPIGVPLSRTTRQADKAKDE